MWELNRLKEGWLYGCTYRGTVLGDWGWFPKSFVGLSSALNDHVWLTSATGQAYTSPVTGNRALVITGSLHGPSRFIEAVFGSDFAIDVLCYSLCYSCDRRCDYSRGYPSRYAQRASLFASAVVLLSRENYKTCVISEVCSAADSGFLAALSTWVWKGGVLLMANGPGESTGDLFCGEDVAREWFGKPWSSGGSEMELHCAQYNAEWILSDAYAQLDGNVENVYKFEGYLSARNPLVDVPVAESVFQEREAWSEHVEGEWVEEVYYACAVAAGRFGKGLVSVYASECDCEHVLLTIAKMPSAVLWSEVRPFVLAPCNAMKRVAQSLY